MSFDSRQIAIQLDDRQKSSRVEAGEHFSLYSRDLTKEKKKKKKKKNTNYLSPDHGRQASK